MNLDIFGNHEQRHTVRYLALLLLLLTGVASAKTDVVIFSNGDRLTGEIKSLNRGRLRFKTDATDTINIEWDEVAYLSSNQNVQVETNMGARYLGHLVPAQEKRNIIVETDAGPIQLNNIQIVIMEPIEEKGVNRLDGDITAGYNFAKADKATQIQLGIDLSFRTETRIMGIELDTVIVGSVVEDPAAENSGEIEFSQRENLEMNYTRLLSNRWVAESHISLERNDELGINLRRSIGGGGGRFLKHSNTSIVALRGGLQQSSENLADVDGDIDSWEAYFKLDWDWFLDNSPELDLSTTLEVIPNLTDWGRVRGNFKLNFRWEMINDLFWQLEFYDSYDSRPPIRPSIGDDPERNDYGVITSLGWEF
jgi:hypothetical protein